jgi:alginate O-acetyltransferase complex protein AlgI
MVFSSIIFLVYFLPAFFLVYYLTPRKWKNIVILVGSIFFYSWGAPRFIFVILGTTLIDFFLVRLMDAAGNRIKRRLFLSLSLLINVGLLFYFKYFNFFLSNFNDVLNMMNITGIGWMKIILPIGISFYTFETITYVVDVYRRVHPPLKNFWEYQLYIILFPKLIAGPIIRYHEIADQITGRFKDENVTDRLAGFIRFGFGLAKKVIIANTMGQYADTVFNQPVAALSSSTAWMGILAYTMQIYFDFSGYSDMAIGIGRMMAFRFPENFNSPYTSQSITEFWRRWHITLGAWMKNYLYVPLGGNRVNSKARLYLNLWLVFLASGFWHGASWNFIIWGAFHGFFLVTERAGLLNIYKKIGRIPSVIITFLIVLNGWVFFRIEYFNDAVHFLKTMYSFKDFLQLLQPANGFYLILIAALIISFAVMAKTGKKMEDQIYKPQFNNAASYFTAVAALLLVLVCIARIAVSDFNPFIYFRF